MASYGLLPMYSSNAPYTPYTPYAPYTPYTLYTLYTPLIPATSPAPLLVINVATT